MAAPLGFKTFTTGEVLTAADTNGYLMQGVLVFADAAARTAAITSPQEGQTSYLKDTDVIQVYSGSAWVTKSGGSPLTTKGDLYTYSTTDARLAVGTNNHVLTADSSAATGMKWAAVAASPSSANSTVATQETTTSGSYAALTTAQAVTLTTGTKVLVILTAETTANNSGYQFMSFGVSGATTISASDTYCLKTAISGSVTDDQQRLSSVNFLTVTAGSNTFTAQFKQSGGNAIFKNRQITVIDLGS